MGQQERGCWPFRDPGPGGLQEPLFKGNLTASVGKGHSGISNEAWGGAEWPLWVRVWEVSDLQWSARVLGGIIVEPV